MPSQLTITDVRRGVNALLIADIRKSKLEIRNSEKTLRPSIEAEFRFSNFDFLFSQPAIDKSSLG